MAKATSQPPTLHTPTLQVGPEQFIPWKHKITTINPSQQNKSNNVNYLGRKSRFDRLESSATILNRLLKRLGVDSLYRDNLHLNIVKDIWPEVVGAQMAKLCRCVKLENGTLLISVSSPTIRHHLASNSKAIIDKFNAAVAKGKLASAYDKFNSARSKTNQLSCNIDKSRYSVISLNNLEANSEPSQDTQGPGHPAVVVRSLAFRN